MSEKRYFLGLDGGGTKTHCVLYDLKTDTLEFATGGATNYEALSGGLEELPGAISGIVLPLLASMSLTPADVDAAAFGMGGVDTRMQEEIIGKMIDGLGFGSFVLANDAYLGIKAECGKSGICAVNGSGYSVVGINDRGEMLQIGGHYDMTGDKGGGTYLVPSAVRAVYSQLYKDGPETLMTALFREWLGIESDDEFTQAVAIRIMGDSVGAYSDISKLLYRASGEGDAVARGILTGSGQDYALSIRCVAKRLGMNAPVNVVLVGSQFVRCEDSCANDVIFSLLEPQGFNVRLISTQPVAGALLWALEKGGAAITDEKREELKKRIDGLGR